MTGAFGEGLDTGEPVVTTGEVNVKHGQVVCRIGMTGFDIIGNAVVHEDGDTETLGLAKTRQGIKKIRI